MSIYISPDIPIFNPIFQPKKLLYLVLDHQQKFELVAKICHEIVSQLLGQRTSINVGNIMSRLRPVMLSHIICVQLYWDNELTEV